MKVENAENAIRMLRKWGTQLGWIGEYEYFVLDGKAWSICHDEVHLLEEDWTIIRDAIAAKRNVVQTCTLEG